LVWNFVPLGTVSRAAEPVYPLFAEARLFALHRAGCGFNQPSTNIWVGVFTILIASVRRWFSSF